MVLLTKWLVGRKLHIINQSLHYRVFNVFYLQGFRHITCARVEILMCSKRNATSSSRVYLVSSIDAFMLSPIRKHCGVRTAHTVIFVPKSLGLTRFCWNYSNEVLFHSIPRNFCTNKCQLRSAAVCTVLNRIKILRFLAISIWLYFQTGCWLANSGMFRKCDCGVDLVHSYLCLLELAIKRSLWKVGMGFFSAQ